MTATAPGLSASSVSAIRDGEHGKASRKESFSALLYLLPSLVGVLIFLAIPIVVVVVLAAVGNADADDTKTATEPTQSTPIDYGISGIDPYQFTDVTRAELDAKFPHLTQSERDLLWFKISDIKSVETVK